MKNCRSPLRLLALAALCAGAASGQERYVAGPVRDGGKVTGIVTLAGVDRSPKPEPVTKDADWCGRIKPSARLALGPKGGVKNAVVYIERIAAGKGFPAGEVALLLQRKCEYVPHVLLMTPTMHLEIVNDDPVLHNVHAYHAGPSATSVFNIAQPVKGQRTRIALEQLSGARDVFTTCDAGHPWMSAYIIKARHPYYAVTDQHGRFVLDDVPPGTYALKMWHEGVEVRLTRAGSGTPPVVEEPFEVTRQVEVSAGRTSVVDFSFALRASPGSP